MICIRCGSDVPDQSPQCPNCGQRFAGKKRTFTATTTSFRALEKRRLRTQKASDSLPYAVGEVVDDRYEVRDVLGQGPLGVVYRVFDQEIEVDVALKVMHDEVLPEDRLDAFDRVVKRVRRLSQQNIVRLYDTGGDTARLFTMQLLEGLTLRKVMGLRQDKGQRFTAREAEPILSQVTMALGHAHRHLVHGGLTPENVVILPDVVKLTDFGLYEAIGAAKFVEAQGSVDRARYLAPELLTADAIDLRADIYSLGVLLYELVSGVPFGPESGSIQQVLSAAGVPAIPDGLDAIVARATAEDPEARYESAEAFAEALGIYIDGEEIAAGAPARGGVPLLPEDVTRKVRIPAELRDPEGDEAGVSIDEVSIEIVLDSPPEEAEQSYAEALSDDELDGLIESTESIDHRAAVPVVPPPTPAAKPAGPPPSPVATGAGVVGLVAPPEVAFAEPAPDPRSPAAADAPAGPWFVRSNTGFIVAVALVVGLVALVAFWLMARESSPQSPASTGPVAVADRPAPAAVAPTVVPVSAVPASVVATPSAATATPDAGAPTDASAPTSVAALVAKGPAAQPGSAALGAVVSAGQVAKAPTSASTPVEPPKPVAPKPVEPPKAVAPKPVEPPKAVAPKPVEPPTPVAPTPVEPPPLMGLDLQMTATSTNGVAVPQGSAGGARDGAPDGQGRPGPRAPTEAGPGDAEETVPIAGVTRLPRLIKEVKPEFPDELKRKGVEGKVVLTLEIGVDGRVRKARVVARLHPELDKLARRAALKLRFEPARVGATPVAVNLPYTFYFVID